MIPLELQQAALQLIQRSKKVLVIPSSPVDGDSVGSALALYLVLKKLGKEVTAVCTETIPNVLSFLPGTGLFHRDCQFVQDLIVTIDCRHVDVDAVRHDIQADKLNIIITPKKGKLSPELVSFQKGEGNFDLIITVDAGSIEQFMPIYEANTEMFATLPVLNIDHHVSNDNFGKVNLVDVMASSATVVVMNLINQLGADLIDADVATLLLVGLITDTGSFQNPNTTPDAFSIAAHLIELGARQQEIIQHVYKTKKLSTLKLWGRVLSKLQYDETHRLVWSTISQKDFSDTQSKPEESEGVIDELMSNAPGAEIIVLLKDRGNGVVSGSIRTVTPQIPASELAEKFGGGGHLQAAGFKLPGKTLEEVEQNVVEALKVYQKERLRLEVQEKVAVEKQVPVVSVSAVPSVVQPQVQSQVQTQVQAQEKPLEVEAPLPSQTPVLTSLMQEKFSSQPQNPVPSPAPMPVSKPIQNPSSVPAPTLVVPIVQPPVQAPKPTFPTPLDM